MKKTLENHGTKTVAIRVSNSDTKRATLASTICGDGHKLKPLLIFKGKPGGRIEREFSNYCNDCFYGVQEKAWMDERLVYFWIEKILAPDIENVPPGIIPVVILDSYKVHLMGSVVNKIEELGAEVWHIPGGCTSLCQPVDVGFNKPLKDRIRETWEHWMICEGLESGKAPSRKVVVNWVVDAYKAISIEIVRNAWRHGEYSWFEEECSI